MALTPEGTPYVEASDLVAAYPAASLSLANRVDLVGVLPFADSAARATAIPSPTDGQFTYLQDTNSTEFYNGSAFEALGSGKILQVIRATDTTTRSTTSLSFVDASISVTITPKKSTSLVLLIWANVYVCGAANVFGVSQITDSSNNAISGAEGSSVGVNPGGAIAGTNTLFAYDTPATTSATTYKGRFKTNSGTFELRNMESTGQLYAIEVSA